MLVRSCLLTLACLAALAGAPPPPNLSKPINYVSWANKHYDTVGEALLWTIERELGEDFTPEVKDAWVAFYTLLARIMKEAAEAEAAA